MLFTLLKNRVLRITLNRAEKKNALNAAGCEQMINQVNRAQANPAVGCILIEAAGNVFCAGMDLDEALTADSRLDELHEQLFSMRRRSEKPIVVSVNGAALGGGLGLVAQGHVVMCSESAAFGLPEIRIGLFPFFIYRSVASTIGDRRTLQAALTGKMFYPEEAMQWGLVQKVVSSVALGERVQLLAEEIARASPEVLALGLEYVRRSDGISDVEASKVASELRARVMTSADFREGVAAFKEKREPHWPSMPDGAYDED